MPNDWARFCKARDLSVTGDVIAVSFHDGRSHQVRVAEESDGWRLTAVVARAGDLGNVAAPALKAWERNQSMRLAGFRIDERGRLVGEELVPGAGMTAEEFQTYVRALAAECDRFEYLLTGRDVE